MHLSTSYTHTQTHTQTVPMQSLYTESTQLTLNHTINHSQLFYFVMSFGKV